MSTPDVQPLEQTSVEHDGRVYTGVGVGEEALESSVGQTSFGQKGESKASDESPSDAPKQTRGQRRFSELTSQRDQERARAEAAEAKARELEARLSAPREPAKESATPAKEGAPAKAAASTTLRARPSINEIGAKYPDWDAYMADDTAWIDEKIAHTEKKLEAQSEQRIEAERASRAFGQTVADVSERGRKAYTDFDAVIAKATVEFPGPVIQAILHDPDSEHLQYALASDPALSERLAKLSDLVEVGKELGRLAAGRASASPASPARPVPTTKAPPPYQPVSGAARSASPSLDELAKAGKYEDYKAARHAAMGVKAR